MSVFAEPVSRLKDVPAPAVVPDETLGSYVTVAVLTRPLVVPVAVKVSAPPARSGTVPTVEEHPPVAKTKHEVGFALEPVIEAPAIVKVTVSPAAKPVTVAVKVAVVKSTGEVPLAVWLILKDGLTTFDGPVACAKVGE